MLAGLLGAALGVIEKYIPEGTERTKVVADVTVRAIESLGWAHRWLAIIFGAALAINTVAVPLVPIVTGQHYPVVWFAVLLQFTVLLLLLGRSVKEIRDLWKMVREESGRD